MTLYLSRQPPVTGVRFLAWPEGSP